MMIVVLIVVTKSVMFSVRRLAHNVEGIFLGNALSNTRSGVNVKSCKGLSASSAPSNMQLIGNIFAIINIALNAQLIIKRQRSIGCFLCKKNHRREMDGSDGEIPSDDGDEVNNT